MDAVPPPLHIHSRVAFSDMLIALRRSSFLCDCGGKSQKGENGDVIVLVKVPNTVGPKDSQKSKREMVDLLDITFLQGWEFAL